MKNSTQKGFTLIELLVVIAIIGILSGVVIASLTAARNRGADSAIKADMHQMLSQAQNYLDTNSLSSFGTAANCTSGLFADSQMTLGIANITLNLPAGATMTCYSSGSNWALSVSNMKAAGTSWCIDNNQGWFKAGTAQSTGSCQ